MKMALNKNDYLDGDGNYDLKKDLVDEVIDGVNGIDAKVESVVASVANIPDALTFNINSSYQHLTKGKSYSIHGWGSNADLGWPVTTVATRAVMVIYAMNNDYGLFICSVNTSQYIGYWTGNFVAWTAV